MLVMLWSVHVQKVPQASEYLCPAKPQTRCDIQMNYLRDNPAQCVISVVFQNPIFNGYNQIRVQLMIVTQLLSSLAIKSQGTFDKVG